MTPSEIEFRNQPQRKLITDSFRAVRRCLCGALALLALTASSPAQVNVTTYHNDIGRTGQNQNEKILNLSNVNATQFGRLFSQPVDGQVYAQPLYLANISIGGVTHNVVFVATEHDSVYAFDADSNGGSNSSPLWKASLLDAAHGAAAGATSAPSADLSTDIQPEVGITGTPVIDASSNTLYVVSKSIENGAAVQRLHALSVTTGAEKLGGPIVITASVPGTGNGSSGGTLTFDSMWENQRPGLLLLNGIVYVGFAAHGDNGPWHGWIFAYKAGTLARTGVVSTSPNGVGSGIWMSGDGLAADVTDPAGHPYGRMFVATGNGDFTASAPYNNTMDYGDSEIRLDLSNGVPTIQDDFTPYNQATLDAGDGDLGSGGAILLPDQTTGSHTHLLVQTGKQGTLNLVDRDSMGGYHGSDNIVQSIPAAMGHGVWATPAYWNGNVYYGGASDNLKSFALANGLLSTTPVRSNENYGFPGATPSVSSNGNTQGILWSLDTSGYNSNGAAVLHAHDATNIATTLYSSGTNYSRDNPGLAVKFAVPTVTNGKVYVGASGQMTVFGLLGSIKQAATPVLSPGTGTFSGTASVTISESTPNSIIYYTTDGTVPTVSSKVYTGPISLSLTTTVNAIASASGYLQSQVASATYTNLNQAAVPVLSLATGNYTGNQTVTITDTTANAVIYYTTDGSVPTTSSARYSGPLTVTTATTLSAIAAAPGLVASNVVRAVYTIIGPNAFDFGQGFATSQNYVLLNGFAKLDDSRLQLTDGNTNEASSAWYYTPVSVASFTTNFTFQLSNPVGNGITFTIQRAGLTAVGSSGGGLAYQGIGTSIAIKFDLVDNAGEGPNSTGLFQNGAMPTVPAIDLTSAGINLHSDDTMAIKLVYDGTTLAMTITDTVTKAVFTKNWTINIPSVVGGNTAYIGFTGATGASTASQKMLTWNYTAGLVQPTAASPSFNPAGGTFAASQSVSISDATTGATIYYTTDGTTPTTSSTKYTGPITVSATKTLKAMASAPGFANSPVTTATYTINPVLPTPVITPAGGTYTSVQTVAITDTNSSAAIYYTTNGATPTSASTKYTGPITVSSSETVKAIAILSGFTNSAVASAGYVINIGGSSAQTYINFSNGFTNSGLSYNGGASVTSSLLRLTDGATWEDRSAWFSTAVPVQNFVTDFTFQMLSPVADGFTFTVQGKGTGALGLVGGGLGYQSITQSVAVKFDLFDNTGEGPDSVGFYINGVQPSTPAINLSSTGINLHSGDTFHAHLVYDGANLVLTLTDTKTNASVTETYAVNIPSIVGSNTAYVGFTAGTGVDACTQNILTWTYSGGSLGATASPTVSPAAGTYKTSQSVTLSDTTPGAIIHYTTDGTTPTTSSRQYVAPINIKTTSSLFGAPVTVKAIAVAPNYSASAVVSAAYLITTASPVITPGPGTYASGQTVTLSSTTPNAVLHYTTNGTTPTYASPTYSAPIKLKSGTTVIKVFAHTAYLYPSPVVSGTYTVNP